MRLELNGDDLVYPMRTTVCGDGRVVEKRRVDLLLGRIYPRWIRASFRKRNLELGYEVFFVNCIGLRRDQNFK